MGERYLWPTVKDVASWRPPHPGRGPIGWWWILLVPVVFLPPLLFLLFIMNSSPSTDSIRTDRNGVFYFATVTKGPRLALGKGETLEDPEPAVLAAACRSYADWLDDRVISPGVQMLVDPGLIRSAELLTGRFADVPVAFVAEERFMQFGDRDMAVLSMRNSGITGTELHLARNYLQARRDPPSADARKRFVVYSVDHTTKSVLIVRQEIDPAAELVDEPTFHDIGSIEVILRDGTLAEVPQEHCWK